jgi:hypothetical protein
VAEEVKKANKLINVVFNLLPTFFDYKGYIVQADNFKRSISILDNLLNRAYYGVMTSGEQFFLDCGSEKAS